MLYCFYFIALSSLETHLYSIAVVEIRCHRFVRALWMNLPSQQGVWHNSANLHLPGVHVHSPIWRDASHSTVDIFVCASYCWLVHNLGNMMLVTPRLWVQSLYGPFTKDLDSVVLVSPF